MVGKVATVVYFVACLFNSTVIFFKKKKKKKKQELNCASLEVGILWLLPCKSVQ